MMYRIGALLVPLLIAPAISHANIIEAVSGAALGTFSKVAEMGAIAYIAYLIFANAHVAMFFSLLLICYFSLKQVRYALGDGEAEIKTIAEFTQDRSISWFEGTYLVIRWLRRAIPIVGMTTIAGASLWMAYTIFQEMRLFSSAF